MVNVRSEKYRARRRSFLPIFRARTFSSYEKSSREEKEGKLMDFFSVECPARIDK